MKLTQILSEIEFYTYEAMVKVIYDGESTSKVAELIRALPGVTTVTLASDLGKGQEVLKVKLISQKTGIEAFQALKRNAIKRYPPIKSVTIGDKTIEKK